MEGARKDLRDPVPRRSREDRAKLAAYGCAFVGGTPAADRGWLTRLKSGRSFRAGGQGGRRREPGQRQPRGVLRAFGPPLWSLAGFLPGSGGRRRSRWGLGPVEWPAWTFISHLG